jgi:ferredoxin
MDTQIRKHQLNAKRKFYVDQDLCTASGACVDLAPDHFKMDEEYCVFVIKQPETPEEERRCRLAIECCPVAAIHVKDIQE